MDSVFILLKRDLKNSLSKRMLFLLLFMILLQSWFIFGSGSVSNVLASNKLSFMEIVFSFNFFGSVVALALTYDCISQERENKVLDIMLTSSISKKDVIFSKIMNCVILSMIFALIYVSAMFLEYIMLTKNLGISMLCYRYFIPIGVFLSIFSIMGLMISIIVRSSREAFVISVIIGGIFMPRIFILIADGIGSALNLSDNITSVMEMLSPALIMNALAGYDGSSKIILALCFASVYLLSMFVFSGVFFIRQDEMNYGE